MTLAQAHEGQELTVKHLEGDFGFRRRLLGLGIHPDQRLYVLKSGILGGPILVRVQGSSVAIGREAAGKVEVELSNG
jgi:Fe2+ transport system protein FeoA